MQNSGEEKGFDRERRKSRRRSRLMELCAGLVGASLAAYCFSLFPSIDTSALRTHSDKGFKVCFDVAPLSPPTPEILSRLESLRPIAEKISKHFPSGQENLPWLLALALHESGANPRAISPTGCGGYLAFSRTTEPVKACCVQDEKDGYLYEYDLCNSEEVYGYHCEFDKDTRFHPDASITRGFSDLENFLISVRHAESEGASIDRAAALTVFWNSGVESVPNFPKTLISASTMVEQLNVTSFPPYSNWTTQSLINKMVETFDYAYWLTFIAHQVVGVPGSIIAFPSIKDEDTLACLTYAPRALGTASENRIEYVSGAEAIWTKLKLPKAHIMRLRYGKYLAADAWVELPKRNPPQ